MKWIFKLFLVITVLGPADLLFGQVSFNPDVLEARLQERMDAAVEQRKAASSVVSQAKEYLASYYGRNDFSAQEWGRVQDFKRWLAANEESLNRQFSSEMGSAEEYNSLSQEQKEAAMGTWLGMKYAVDKIGGKPDKSFPVQLTTEGGDRADKGSILLTEGGFVEKINIGVHEAVHLMPNARLRYGYTPAVYGEKYAVAAQQRYGLPVKEGSNAMAGARSFFPAYQAGQSAGLLKEYTEGIAALIDYDDVWDNKQWDLAGCTDKLLGDRLKETVVSLVEKGEVADAEGYSPAMNEYLKSVGEKIAEDCCKQLSGEEQTNKKELVNKYFDEHADKVAKIASEELRSVASQNLPPIPEGYM